MDKLNIYQKLVEIRKVVTHLQKENEGEGLKYKYVSSSQVLHAVRAKMDELQVFLVSKISGHEIGESPIEYFDKEGRVTKRTTTYFTQLDMTMTWVNAEVPTEIVECQWYAQGVDIGGEKGVGKALTYGEKYFILRQFNIPTDSDDPDSPQHGNRADTYVPKSKAPTNEEYTQTGNESRSTVAQTDGISQGQLNMLYAKASAAGFKTEDKDKLTARVSDFLEYPVTDMKEVKKADVTKLAQFLDKQKKAS